RLISIYERTNANAKIGWWEVDFETGEIEWSPITKSIHEVPENYIPTISDAINFYKEEHRAIVTEAVINCLVYGTPYEFELELTTAKNKNIWVSAIGAPEFLEPGETIKLHESFKDIRHVLQQRPVK
ncbi:PAS domain-containing protein, partial [Escherichia coli]